MHARKSTLIAAIVVAILMAGARRASAIPIFFSWGDEKVIKVADFPNTEDFKTREGKHIDAGYRYKQFSLFFVPVWNYDGQWCGYVGDSGHYLELDKAKLDQLAAFGASKLPDAPRLPAWDSYGGKVLLLVCLVIYWTRKSRAASTEDRRVSQAPGLGG
ncbi:MAG TPA: hypothetical protein VIE43_02265 [Thermoanaerobaculia bacterium]|jgi:hypothetical protein|nr:hypothetical protein [Thermoanaerobaculia bacterium]